MQHDASSTVPHVEAHRTAPLFSIPSSPSTGLGWRHLATALLLIVALPVFGVAALVCLPLLVLGAVVQQLLRVRALLPAPSTPARMIRAR